MDERESFWFLTGEDDAPAERWHDLGGGYEAAPLYQSMRGERSFTRAPSADQKKVRRQIHRSGAHAYEEVDWDEIHPTLKDWADDGEIHRGVGVNLPGPLHDLVHDESRPVHERAQALLDHLTGERNDPRDRRTGLGMHWSLAKGIAEDSAEKSAEHYADVNDGDESTHDFAYGRTPGEFDHEAVQQHLHEHHGLHPDEQPGEPEDLVQMHRHLHEPPQISGQQALFPAPARSEEGQRHFDLAEEYTPDEPHPRPGTAVVLHTPVPDKDDIETHIHGNPNAGGEVYHPFGHGEREVPVRSGASLPITGISWKPMHSSWHYPDDEPDYVHHRFAEPVHREARKTAMWGQWGDDYAPSNWDEAYPHDPNDERHTTGIHRALKIPMDNELFRHMAGNSGASREEVAHHVLKAVTQHPHLGLHWTDDLNHAYRVARASNWGMGRSWYSDQDGDPGYGLPGTVIVHAKWPKREHIETDPATLKRYNVGPYGEDHDGEEWEVPMKTGAPVHITGVSWSMYDTPHKGDFTRHDFAEPKQHTAKTATVLNTQVERLNKGDQVRTPTGQTVTITGKPRPHETDSSLVYIDTEAGTSTVKRGTPFQVVPYNAQQQELPDIGDPMGQGNTAELPGSGRTPGGPGAGHMHLPTSASACPNCGNSGTMRMHGGNYVCSVCGFTEVAGGTPGGLIMSPQQHGYTPARRKPGEVPQAHVWASKYTASSGQMARRMRQVLGEEEL